MRSYIFVLLNTFALSSYAAALNIAVTDKTGAPLQDAVVYAIPTNGRVATSPTTEIATIAQQGRQFTPYVTVLKTGGQIKFPNYDKIEHHVKSFSTAKEFEMKIYEAGTPPPVIFDKPGVVIIYCMLHDWMRAYVLVVDTPYFAKTDGAGNALLNNLPEGGYEIKAWHPDFGAYKQPLSVTAKVSNLSNTPVTFNFDLIPKKRKSVKE